MELTYDRGTLLLRPGEGRPAPRRLNTMRWDARVEAWRAPALAHAEVLGELAGRGLAVRDHAGAALEAADGVHGAEARAGSARASATGLREPPLADHQAAALAAWEAASRRGVVALPTGAGKTRVGVAAAARLRRNAIVLVPTRALLAQWAAELARWTDAPVGRLGDGWNDLRPLTVATYESASRHAETLGCRFALIVADEAHHASGDRWADALRCSLAPARLGLTATPPEPGPALARLEHLIGPVACARTVSELTPRHLAALRRIVLEVVLAPDDQRRVSALWNRWSLLARAAAERAPGRPWPDVARELARDAEGRRALAARAEAERLVASAPQKVGLARELLRRHAGERLLLFTSDNDAAYAASSALLVPAVTTDVRGREREALLRAFGDGSLRALVSSAVLNEGIDVPDARVAIVLGGRRGRREHVQRLGRILRPRPGKTALVYELVARGTFEDPRRRRREVEAAPRHAAPRHARPETAPPPAARPDAAPPPTAPPDAAPRPTARPDPAPRPTARPEAAPRQAARPEAAPRQAARPEAAPRSPGGTARRRPTG